MRRERIVQSATRRGALLIIVLVLLLVASSIAAAILHVSLINARQFTTTRNIMQADRLSEAGLSLGASRLTADPRYQGEVWKVDLPESEGVVQIRVESNSATQKITSTASFPANSKTPARTTRMLELPPPVRP